MSVHLQKTRLYTTTKNQKDAGTDAAIEFGFDAPSQLTTYPTPGWNWQALDHPWDDFEEGRSDAYEVDYQGGNRGMSVSGTPVPRGLGFANWQEARKAKFKLRTKGNDWLRLDHYAMLGYFRELRHVPGTIDSFDTIDHGWLLMSWRDRDIDLSTDPREGTRTHSFKLNGTFAGP